MLNISQSRNSFSMVRLRKNLAGEKTLPRYKKDKVAAVESKARILQKRYEKYPELLRQILESKEFLELYKETTGAEFNIHWHLERHHGVREIAIEIQILTGPCWGEYERREKENVRKANILTLPEQDPMRRRRLLVRLARPRWADMEKIKQIYAECRLLNEHCDEIKYHVDHIIPIQGKNVCGLHVEYNLQVITAKNNLRKSNKFL